MRSHVRFFHLSNMIKEYDGKSPFHVYLKTIFRKNKKFGSKDRAFYRQAAYNFLRMGCGGNDLQIDERILIANWAFRNNSEPTLDDLISKHTQLKTLTPSLNIQEKLEMVQNLYTKYNLTDIFPFYDAISPKIELQKYLTNLFKINKVWIRVRKGFMNHVLMEFADLKIPVNIAFKEENCLGFEKDIQLTEVHSYKKGLFEIQDISSQRSLEHIEARNGSRWWDCCAGSGGKSLLLLDKNSNIKLLCTDSRKSILENLTTRLEKTGFTTAKKNMIDLMKDALPESEFDGILLDAPCSGSGTWGRNPEQLQFFNRDTLKTFHHLQLSISRRAVDRLKLGGELHYITCSIFYEENEAVVKILAKEGLEISFQKYVKGYDIGGDAIFVAKLRRIH